MVCLRIHHGGRNVMVCLRIHHGGRSVMVCLRIHHGGRSVMVCLRIHHGGRSVMVCLRIHHGGRSVMVCLRIHHGGRSVMVCLRIHHGGRTSLVHLAGALAGIRYLILQHHAIPHMNINGEMFQHDKARSHDARVSQEFLQHHVKTLSSDLNRTEHLWDELDQSVTRRNPPPQGLL